MYRRWLHVNQCFMLCILSFKISLSEWSEVGPALAEPLSRTEDPIKGQRIFNATPSP